MSARKFDLHSGKENFGIVQVEHVQGYIRVKLHDTEILHYSRNYNTVRLHTGGWYSVTTKRAMNTALHQLRGFEGTLVYQKKGEWYVQHNGIDMFFEDDMLLHRKA